MGRKAHSARNSTPLDSGDPGSYVVGIGASAGGLEALRPLVANLPVISDLCFVIAQHLSPQHRSMMVQLLARETKIPVVAINNGVSVKPSTIYIAPPNCDVVYRNGRLVLRTPLEPLGPKPSVDNLFNSLANNLGHRAIAIVLSGTGSDGANGLRAVKAHGGITIAQEPSSAKYESMPRAAITIGGADLVLTPTEIATKLVGISKRHKQHLRLVEKADNAADAYVDIIRNIHRHTGIDFGKYKETTLRRQIARRMSALQVASLTDYMGVLDGNKDEIDVLAKNFLISVTSFFRDKESFAALGKLLEKIVREKAPGDPLRIWVPACATGEEAYSIALLLAAKARGRLDKMRVQIFGTDVDGVATAHARRGEYPESSVANLNSNMLRHYFSSNGRIYRVEKAIRNMVVFSRHDLVQDPPFKQIDLISCRNLLIYFKPVLQEQAFRLFHYALRPGGYLFLGKSESLGNAKGFFNSVDARHKIFKRRNVVSHPVNLGRSASTPPPVVPAAESGGRKPEQHDVDLGRMAKNALVARYAPPTILVNQGGEPLHVFGNVSRYLHVGAASGKVDVNILSIIDPDLRAELRALMHRVQRERSAFVGQLHHGKTDGTSAVRLAVQPVEGQDGDEGMLLISFEEAEPLLAPVALPEDAREESAGRQIVALENELRITKENLQTVVEELETSNEELQSVNEELQASNEELQASNEELETANEELQATNEELTTVNDELSVKSNDLAEANSELESILAGSAQAILLIDSMFHVVRSNDKAARLFDLAKMGDRPHLLSVPTIAAQPGLCASVQRAIKSAEAHFEEIVLGKRVFLAQLSPHRLDRKTVGAVMTLSDITALRKAERAAIEQGERAKSLIRNSSDGILTVNSVGQIHVCNPAACDMLEVREHDILGKPVDRLFLKSDLNIRSLVQALLNDGKSPEHRRFHVSLTRHDRERHFDAVINSFELDGERYRSAMLREFTEQFNAQAELAAAKKAAEEANQAKTNFLTKMSHELRTPLNAVVGFSDAILSAIYGPLGHEKYLSYVRDIHNSGVHLLGLINDVFDISKVESGQLRLAENDVEIVGLISKVISVLQPMAAKASVEIVFEFQIREAVLCADELRVRQVLLNVLSNALKFSLPGGKVRTTILVPPQGGLNVIIADRGVGIEQKVIEKLGTEFVTTSGFVSREQDGTGLGLPVSIALMRAHGGDLVIQSAAGQGTTVTLVFPPERVSSPRRVEINPPTSVIVGAIGAPSR